MQQLISGLAERARAANILFYAHGLGSMFGLFFTDAKSIYSEADAKRCNVAFFKRFFHAMLDEGIYLAPSAFEAGFISSAHGEKEIQYTLDAAEKAFARLVSEKAA